MLVHVSILTLVRVFKNDCTRVLFVVQSWFTWGVDRFSFHSVDSFPAVPAL